MSFLNTVHLDPSQFPISSQVPVVDVFFPGLGGISSFIQPLLAGNLNTNAQLLCICAMIVFLIKYIFKYIGDIIETHFTCTFHFSDGDEAHDMLLNWIRAQPFAKQARSVLVTVKSGRETLAATIHSDANKKPLHYTPWNGSVVFWRNNKRFKFRSEKRESSFQRQDISLSCLTRFPAALEDLLEECRDLYLKQTSHKTAIFQSQDDGWRKTTTREHRPLDTVVMKKEVKDDLLQDISKFLNPGARAWYARRSLPYTRGYLFHGPPGTGKSSISLSVAGKFDMDVYVLNLASVNDDTLTRRLNRLPPRCVVLLEDVDAAGMTQSRETEPDTDDSSAVSQEKSQGRVTLSGLLNALDGVASPEGRVLIMTTNHIERLDKALIRPGRIDKPVLFGLADGDMLADLFRNIFKLMDDEIEHDRVHIEDMDTIEKMAAAFARNVPKEEFSPAEILSFLLEHRESPSEAVGNVQAWAHRAREERNQTGGPGSTSLNHRPWAVEQGGQEVMSLQDLGFSLFGDN